MRDTGIRRTLMATVFFRAALPLSGIPAARRAGETRETSHIENQGEFGRVLPAPEGTTVPKAYMPE